MTTEQREIEGWPGYLVSRCGAVTSMKYGSPRRLAPDVSNGYARVVLSNKNTKSRVAVHALVARAWLGPCPPGHECDHIDFDRLNNNADNLRWLPRSENIGRKSPLSREKMRALSRARFKYGHDTALAAVWMVKRMGARQIDAARALGVKPVAVWAWCNGVNMPQLLEKVGV